MWALLGRAKRAFTTVFFNYHMFFPSGQGLWVVRRGSVDLVKVLGLPGDNVFISFALIFIL